MLIDFNKIQEATIPCMNNGIGTMSVRMHNDEKYRIIYHHYNLSRKRRAEAWCNAYLS